MRVVRVLMTCLGALVLVVVLINGAYMLISPRAFFRLPKWIRAQGNLRQDQYESEPGALGLRILGAITFGMSSWMAYEFVRDLISQYGY